jgi:hypothetical protein
MYIILKIQLRSVYGETNLNLNNTIYFGQYTSDLRNITRPSTKSARFTRRFFNVMSWGSYVIRDFADGTGKRPNNAVSEFIDHWLGDTVNAGIGLSYRHARLHKLAGRYDNPKMPEMTLFLKSETYEFGYRKPNLEVISEYLNNDRRPQGPDILVLSWYAYLCLHIIRIQRCR